MYNYLDFLDKEKECMTNPAGNEYHGTMNKAASGLPCKNWIDVKNYTITASLTVADISKLNDYCRRVPFTEWNGPSCFTFRLERCDVDYCGTTFCVLIIAAVVAIVIIVVILVVIVISATFGTVDTDLPIHYLTIMRLR